MPNNNVRLAVEVSAYIRRVMRELFRDGSGVDITTTAFLMEDDEPGLIDEMSPETAEWQWANAVLMLMRAVYGILEAAESELDEEL